jgi:hypothetical protein
VFRRTLIAGLIALVAVVVAVDRLGALVASHVLAGKVQHDEHLPNRPTVSIGGIPFLTQALGGTYKNVTITAHDVPLHGLSVSTLTVHLHDMHIPFSDVTHDSVSRVPVDQVDGTAFMTFAAINTYLSEHQPAGERRSVRAGPGSTLTVVDRVSSNGRTVTLTGTARASVAQNVVILDISRLVLAGGSPSAFSVKFSAKPIEILVPLNGLQFRLRLGSVTVSATGVTATGAASNIVLGSAVS